MNGIFKIGKNLILHFSWFTFQFSVTVILWGTEKTFLTANKSAWFMVLGKGFKIERVMKMGTFV